MAGKQEIQDAVTGAIKPYLHSNTTTGEQSLNVNIASMSSAAGGDYEDRWVMDDGNSNRVVRQVLVYGEDPDDADAIVTAAFYRDQNGDAYTLLGNAIPWGGGETDSSASGNITVVDSGSSTAAGEDSQSVITGTPTTGSIMSKPSSGDGSFMVQVTGTFNMTLQVEKSVDAGTTWVPCLIFTEGTSIIQSTVTNIGVFRGNAGSASNIRVRCTARVSGTATVVIRSGVGAGSVTVENGVRLAGSDFSLIGARDNALDIIPKGTAVVTNAPTYYRNTALSNTEQAVKTSSGNIYGYAFYNSHASDAAYIKFWDDTVANVIVGTTATTFVPIPIPARGYVELIPNGFPHRTFVNAITIAATLNFADSDNTAPSTAISVHVIRW